MVNQENLPFGLSDFENLRKQKKIYVDKTDLIYELARLNDPLFLSRPRRFGKSLLLSTFESLFSRGIEFFEGLKIEKLWNDKKFYKVIHLDFSTYSCINSEIFDNDISKYLKLFAAKNNISLDYTDESFRAGDILKLIVDNSRENIVVLIDEYDYPLTHCLEDNAKFNLFRDYLQEFFGAIKSVSGKLRFLFITGVGKFAKTSVFSQLNHLNDISLDGKYATLLGYTEDEIHNYFGKYLTEISKKLNLKEELLYSNLKDYYDGYRMTVSSKCCVYNPWSILNFLRKPEEGFKNYWYETGGAYPTLVTKYIKNLQKTPLAELQKKVITEENLREFYDYFDVPAAGLLYQTGYLTIKEEYDNKLLINRLILCPPNLEVKSALAKLYLKQVRETPITADDETVARTLYKDFENHNYEALITHLNIVLNTFGYDNKVAFADERNCRDFLDLALCVAGIKTTKEQINSLGRADLVVELDRYRFVFEFKLSKDNDDEKLLKEAEDQLNKQKYGQILPIKKIIKIALVVNAKAKSITKWSVT
ncbi:MAG: ATP-binding protein [Lachnospiraceae bacterium]|nr:ATP-binding protein [Lachnospiraceae bacterium]